jgi:gliding motility-associated-like protein
MVWQLSAMYSTLSLNWRNETTFFHIAMKCPPLIVGLAFCTGLLFYAGSLKAQNLVLNPGFEDRSACPNFIDQLHLATHWSRPTPGTSDYFNACATFAGVLTPDNGFGSQVPYDGDAYAGLVTYVDTAAYPGFSHYREYLKGTVSEPLQSGKYYATSFQVSVAEQYRFGSNNLGMYFSAAIPAWSGSPTDYPALGEAPYGWTPQVEYTGAPISATAGWVEVADTFQAAGGELQFVLGNFRSDHVTARTAVHPWASAMAYFFVDAVSVERLYFPPVALRDTGSTTGTEPVWVAVLDNDSDADGYLDPSTLTLMSVPAGGIAEVEDGTGEISYTAFEGFTGLDSVRYQICDEEGLCAEAWMVISVGEPVPADLNLLAVDDWTSTSWHSWVEIPVLANDLRGTHDIDPASLTASVDPALGEVSVLASTGVLQFRPSTDQCGAISLTYTVCDTTGLCSDAVVHVQVLCATTWCSDDTYTLENGEVAELDVLLNDTPGNGGWDLNTLSLKSTPQNGSVEWLNNGQLRFTVGNVPGQTERIAYEVCDLAGICDQAWITVRVPEEPISNNPGNPELFIPNVITPNGDGFNDAWVLQNLQHYDEHEVTVINRWENKVLSTTGYQNDWRGDNLPDGTYFYIIRTRRGSEHEVFTGALTIYR